MRYPKTCGSLVAAFLRAILIVALAICCKPESEANMSTIEQITGQAPDGYAEIHGVGAGPFEPSLWEQENLHFLPDFRHPFLSPLLKGVFRNIYAPSAVVLDSGAFRIFYGAWDGVDTGNDRIYSIDTADFLDLTNRREVINHNTFTHICNVNCIRLPGGEFRMMCTAYPDPNGRNKPIVFTSPDGGTWNGSPAPYPAKTSDLVTIENYPNYPDADINGMNVLFHEDDTFFIYFCDFKNFGPVFRARSADGKRFLYEGPVLEAAAMVNDVKIFLVAGKPWYLMGLHRNREDLFYSLSNDPLRFPPKKKLAVNLDKEDRFIVAIGWVVQGECLLGFLYGAGAHASLDRNRISARWLQKKVVFVDQQGNRHEPTRSLGPDRQLIPAPAQPLEGHFEIYNEDGATQEVQSIPAILQERRIFAIR